jgi:hypothetical protein
MNTLWRPYCGSLMVGLLIATSPSAWRFYDVMYYQMESLENILLNVKEKYHNVAVGVGGNKVMISWQHLEFCNTKFDSVYPLDI